MKFKNNFKRFFTLDRHHDAGFTLVELIVVIAILAILAGVAVPAYSGYIKKAEKANDLQLLGAVNQAFAAAAMENDKQLTKLVGTEIALDANGKISSMTVNEATASGEAAEAPMFTSFKKYYGTNIDVAFKYFHTKLTYTEDGFEGLEPGQKDTGLFGQIFDQLGSQIQASVNKVTGSTFGEIGSEELMNKVDTVTGLASNLALINPAVKQALTNNLVGLAESLGYDLDDEKSAAEFDVMMEELMAERAAQLNPEDPALAMNQAYNDIIANYAVLQAAQTQAATGKTTDAWLTELQAGVSAEDIKGLLQSENVATTQDGISKAAMMYAMYTAYANQMPETTEEEKAAKQEAQAATKNAMDFAAHMEDPGFVAYLNGTTGNASADLEGYLGALDIINQSASGNKDAVGDLLVNGYTDPTLVAALQGLLGK